MRMIATWMVCLCVGVLAGPLWCLAEDIEDMRILPVCVSAPEIDGNLDDPAWQTAIKVSDWHVITSEAQEAYAGPRVWATHDDTWLYVAYDIPHPHPETIRPYCTRHDERVQGENCVKLCFAAGDRGKDYFIFRVSAGNVRSEQRIYDVGWNIPWRSATKITESGWTVEIALPLCKLTTRKTISSARMNFIVCILSPEPNVNRDAYEEFGQAAFRRTLIAWGPTLGTSNYLPKHIFDMGRVQITNTFLPYLESAEVGEYSTKGEAVSYTVSAQLREMGGQGGTVSLVAVDQVTDGGEKREAIQSAKLGKNERLLAELIVPMAGKSRRDVQVLLKDTETGEVLQAYRQFSPDRVALLSAYSERNYYTTESNAVAVCRTLLSPEDLADKTLAAVSEDGAILGSGRPLATETDLCIPVRSLRAGKNRVAIVLQDRSGNALAKDYIEMVRKKPNPGREVKINQRTRVLIKNGKPFFPFGFYAMGQKREEFAELAEGGMNTVLKLGWTQPVERLERLLDDLEEAGLYLIAPLIIGSNSSSGQCDILTQVKSDLFYQSKSRLNYIERSRVFKEAFDKELPGMLKNLERVKNHPAILAWYTFDEPVSKRVFAMYRQGRELYQSIYALDGYRPVYQMGMTSVKTCPEDSDWADILGHDPYWVPGHPNAATIHETAAITRRVRKAADEDRKPTWMILTSERWSATYKRFLNPVENRCQAYLAIISGARGLLYYYYPIQFQANWEMFCRLASEISTLSPVILTDDVPQTIQTIQNEREVRYGDVLVKLFPDSDGQGYVLLAANQARYPVDASFCLKDSCRHLRVTNVFAEATSPELFVVDNGFSDRFEPLGVRVFRLSGTFTRPLKMTLKLTSHPEDGENEPDAYIVARGKPEKNRIPNASFEDETNPGFPDYYKIPWFKQAKTERIGLPGCPFVLDRDNPWHGQQSLCLRNGDAYVYPLKFLLGEKRPSVFSLYMRADRADIRVALLVNGKSIGEPVSLGMEWERHVFPLPRGAGSMELRPEKNSAVWFDALQLETGAAATPFEL